MIIQIIMMTLIMIMAPIALFRCVSSQEFPLLRISNNNTYEKLTSAIAGYLLLGALRPIRLGSADWWMASLPTCFQHRLPGFYGVVAQHPSPGLRDWVVGWPPVKRPQDHPLRTSRRRIGFELNNLVLISVHKPTLTPCTHRLIVVIGAEPGH